MATIDYGQGPVETDVSALAAGRDSGTGLALPKSTPTMLSSQQGADFVQQSQQKLSQLSGTPPIEGQFYEGKGTYQPDGTYSNPTASKSSTTQTQTPNTNTGTQTTQTQEGKIKYLNLDGQSQELTGSAITPEAVQSLLDQGYYSIESTGGVPGWATTGDVTLGRQQAQAQKDLNAAQQEFDTLKQGLQKFTISDQELQGTINAITGQWDSRIADMQRINSQRDQSIQTLGERLGDRWTGGKGGMFGGIIVEEERQGVQRIASLEADKQTAIAAAKEAARSKNWEVYSKQVGLAEQAYRDKLDAVKTLNAKVAETNAKLQEEQKIANRDTTIADILKSGTTDIRDIMDKLKAQGINASAKDVQDSITALSPTGAKDLGDIMKSASQNGAPASIIDAISKATTVGDAIKAAGTYLQSTSGMVGEYLFYKRQAEAMGQTPVDFNAYQTMDANRKIAIAKATVGDSGLTSTQVTILNGIIDKYNKSALIAASDRTIVLKSAIEQLKTDPSNGPKQLNLVYSYIQALDTYQSSVREGELSLVNSIDSKVGKLSNYVQQIQNGQIVRPEVAKEIADAASLLVDTISRGAQQKAKSFESQAQVAGVGEAWKKFQSGFDPSYGNSTTNTLLQSETQAEDALKSYTQAHPEKAAEVSGRIQSMESALGRSITSQELLQAFPEYGGSFNQVGNTSASQTSMNTKPVVIAGYDIATYATDPNHESNVRKIYSTVANAVTNSASSIDSYIQRIARLNGSSSAPVKGTDVLAAANQYNVDPHMILAIMQADSHFGIVGKAVRTHNPGNVGNDDTGRTVDYGSVRNGVFAVARNLSKRRIS